ncbi:hypothetical protein WN944_007481 [Citrus x changshan-huyou]|uniref:Transcription factor bHLH96 n=3 Tax=Citrus TaxID=2706 RepID=A0ACB8KKS0_CITSI|nr:transcription factor bHLH96 [Citrus sinensis]KDO59549.1 hypothetical protein CISIN_1g036531mg [Citrus sinensis]
MALEAVVYQQDFLSYNGSKDINNLLGCPFDDHHFLENQTESFLDGDYWNNNSTSSSPPAPTPSIMVPNFNEFYSEDANANVNANVSSILDADHPLHQMDITLPNNRPKRRRAKSRKNQEEIENQRMTHIAVERNRRKQMNEYLSVLRSLMPDSYVQRGDQASIIGGAINFVKELEQRLQSLGARKEIKENSESGSTLFAEFFAFPQYSTSSSRSESEAIMSNETQNSIADIEVNMVESHANLKIRSKRRPKQLLKLVSGLQSMRLTILHFNVTTADEIVLYSLSVKVEDDCNLTSGDDIATAVYQLLGRIQEDASLN